MRRRTAVATVRRQVWRDYFASARSLPVPSPEPLVTRLRAALVVRATPMKVYELARLVDAHVDVVHRTLCRHRRDFVCASGADRVECWTVRATAPEGGTAA